MIEKVDCDNAQLSPAAHICKNWLLFLVVIVFLCFFFLTFYLTARVVLDRDHQK